MNNSCSHITSCYCAPGAYTCACEKAEVGIFGDVKLWENRWLSQTPLLVSRLAWGFITRLRSSSNKLRSEEFPWSWCAYKPVREALLLNQNVTGTLDLPNKAGVSLSCHPRARSGGHRFKMVWRLIVAVHLGRTKNCFHQTCLWAICGAFSCLLVDTGGLSPLWVALPLDR